MAYTNLLTEVFEELLTEAGEEVILETADQSERYYILSKVIEVLQTITHANGYLTDVKYVSEVLNIKHPEELDKNKFPALFPIDGEEVKEAFALFDGVSDDMSSTLNMIITGMIYDRTGATSLARSNLIKDIEMAMVMDDDLTALLMERPSPTKITTDKGFFGNYSVFDFEFELKYLYDHTYGG